MTSRGTRNGSLAAAVAVGFALAVASSNADAQFDTHSRATGFEGSFHIGGGAFTNSARFCPSGSSCSGTGFLDGSVGFQFHVGYRIVPAFTAGIHFGYQVLSLNANAHANGGGGSATGLGLYAQLHLLELLPALPASVEKLDVAAGLGVDLYANVSGWADTVFGHIDVSGNGIAVPITLSIDYALLDFLSVGVLLMAAPWGVYNECTHAGGSTITTCDSSGRQAEGYFFAGAGVRGHFNPFR